MVQNRNQPFLQNKIRKVGVANIKIHFLHKNLTEEEAFQKEKYWIKYYGRRNLGAGTLCNLTDGGEGTIGHVCSEETKRKLSEINKGKILSNATKQKIAEASKGRKHTDEAKQKLSESKKGEKNPMYGQSHTDEVKLKLSGIHKGKKLSKEHCRKISEAKKGKNHPMYGKHWSEEALCKRRGKHKHRNSTIRYLRKNGASLRVLAAVTQLSRQQVSFICCTA